jgi:hypothetical protein
MSRMQFRRLHRTALALAGAAIVASSLMTTGAAAAAPASSLPLAAGPETVAVINRDLNLPVTDAKIYLSNVQNMGGGKIYFGGGIVNAGPKTATLRLTVTAVKADGTTTKDSKQFTNLAPNDPEGYGVLCEPDAQGRPCIGATFKVEVVNGLDSNLQDNSVFRDNTFGVVSY